MKLKKSNLTRITQQPTAVPRGYRLVPGVIAWIEKTLKQQGLTPVPFDFRPGIAAKKGARFYMTPVKYRGGLAWFKASLKSEPRLLDGLRDEISTQRALADYEHRTQISFDSPSWLAGSSTRDRAWLLRRYWKGIYAGAMPDDFGFSAAFVRLIKPRRMATIVRDIGRMSRLMRRRLDLPTHDHGWYRLDYQYYQRKFLPKLLKHPLNPGWTTQHLLDWEALLASHRKFLKRQATVFSHGDLYPNNLMLTGRGRRRTVVVFDWELANWNLPAFDAVLIWLLAWRYPAWQTKFRREYLGQFSNTLTINRAWNMAQFSLGVRLLTYAFERRTNAQPKRYGLLPRRRWLVAESMLRSMAAAVNQGVATL